MHKSSKLSVSAQPLNIIFNIISTDTYLKNNNMKTILLLMLYLTSISGSNRYRRSCSRDLQTAFASLIKKRHLIISVPEEEQTMHVQQLPSIYNQPCNQQAFFENLKHETFLHKHRHNPTFLLKPSYQSPETRCFSLFQQNRDLQRPSLLSQQHEATHAILHLFLDYGTLNQVKNIPNEDRTTNLHLIFPRDADVFLLIFYVVTSFYERHKSIQYFLRTLPTVPDSSERTQPCYVKLTDLPNITHVQYSNTIENIDANTIPECELTSITSIDKTAFNTFHVTFPGGKLTPIAPRNAKNDRLYYKRESTHEPTHPIPWFDLKIITGPARQKPQNLIRILPSANSHLLDHKFLFAPPALRPRHTTITYQHNLELIYNSNFTSPITPNAYPVAITSNPRAHHHYNYLQHNHCSITELHKHLYPFGTHEIELLNIRPPPNPREFCKSLPDPDHPVQTYQILEQMLDNFTMTNHTWFSWSAELDNDSHPNETSLIDQNPYLDQILTLYKNFTPAYNEYTTKLHHAQINKQFATFNLYYYAQEKLFKQNKHLNTQNTQANQQIAANELFTSQQLITLYAKKLWKIHFIRQNLLQKALLIWKTRRFLKTISNYRDFKKDVIYEHTLVQDKIYSWNRLLILGDRDYEHRFTIPAIGPDQETYWSPAKLAALFGSAIAAGTALAYEAYNLLFAGSTLRSDQPFYAQLSLHAINNQTLPLP